MTTAALSDITEAEQGSSLWRDAWLRLRKNHLALFGLIVLALFVLIALLTPWIAPYGYADQNLDLGATPPSAAHWLGTDIFGRDLLTQVMYGGRISLAVGFIATAVALLIGVTWGATAGYVGGRVDAVMMRLVDILYALPFMIFIVLLMVVFGRNMLLLFLAIGAVEWLTMARIMRSQVQSLRQQEFVEAAISLRAEAADLAAQSRLANSFAGRLGRAVEPILRPLGYDWQIGVGILSSFVAREVIVSTLAVVYGVGESTVDEDPRPLYETLEKAKRADGSPVFTVATSVSLLVFYVLALQCVSTLAISRRETNSWKWPLFQLAYMSGLAYLTALVAYQSLRFFGVS